MGPSFGRDAHSPEQIGVGSGKIDQRRQCVVQQQSIILFVDLQAEAQGFRGTLASQGLQVASVSSTEVETAITQGLPRAIIAPESLTQQIAQILRSAHLPADIPFFTLCAGGISAKGALPREVTARLPSDIDAGVLCLRLSTVLGNPPNRRVPQPTLVGVGIEGKAVSTPPLVPGLTVPGPTPGVSPSVVPASRPSAGAYKVPAPSTPSAPPPPPAASGAAQIVAAPTSVATVLSPAKTSAPAVASGVKSAQSASTPPTAPPGATGHAVNPPPTAAGSIPAPSPSSVTSSVGGYAGTAVQNVPSSSAGGVSAGSATSAVTSAVASTSLTPSNATQPPSQGSERPVTASPSDYPPAFDADIAKMGLAQAASRSKKMKIAGILGAIAVLGGAAAYLSGGTGASEGGASVTATQANTPDSGTALPSLPPPGETAKVADAKPDEAAPGEVKPKEGDDADKPGDPDLAADPEAKFFQIASIAKVQSCEEILENPQDYYKKRPNWRATQSWKLARKSLLHGDEKAGLQHMCESAFTDPKGPATLGLARHYLGLRALDEAERWAKLGVEVSPKAKRSAQELLGDIWCQRGKMKEAREIWLESFNLTSDQEDRVAAVVRRFVKAARAARKGGDAPLAERHLRRAAAFDTKDAETLAALASILVMTEQPGLAKIWAEKALEMDSSSKVAKGVLSEL